LLTIVKGPRGSGKTAWVVRELLTIRRNPVVTNIALGYWTKVHVFRLADRKWLKEDVFVLKPPKNVHYIPSGELTVERLIDLARKLRKGRPNIKITMAVDEGGLKWDSRFRGASPERLFWLRFYRVSRHFGFDEVFVITQVETSIDKQIRDLADVVVNLLNLRAAFPVLFGWIPWPWGVMKRRFNGLDDLKSFRWPFYMILPQTLHRYDHRQFAGEFQVEIEQFRQDAAARRAKEARALAAS